MVGVVVHLVVRGEPAEDETTAIVLRHLLSLGRSLCLAVFMAEIWRSLELMHAAAHNGLRWRAVSHLVPTGAVLPFLRHLVLVLRLTDVGTACLLTPGQDQDT